MIELIHPFVIAFAIGLMIGIERERSHPVGVQAMGVRTFILLALLGTIAAWIRDPAFTVVASIFAFGAILLGYYRSSSHRRKHPDIGITTEVSAGVVFTLGYVALIEPLLAAVLGAAVLLVLLSRKRLHKFSRNQLRPDEIRATVTILVIILGVLPLLPDRTIDPWELFNPRRFGLLVTVIAALQFGGYIAIRLFGHRLGVIFMGFFGGLVSSTAVFATLPKLSRERPELTRSITASAMFAQVGMLVETIILLAVASPSFLQAVIWPLIVMIIVGGVSAVLVFHRNPNEDVMTEPMNPLDIKSVLKIAAFIAVMIIFTTIAKRYLGTHGAQLAAFLGGLFEAHGVTLATATLYVQKDLNLLDAEHVLAAAIVASFITKFFLLWTMAHNRFAVWTTLLLLGILSTGGAVYYLAL